MSLTSEFAKLFQRPLMDLGSPVGEEVLGEELASVRRGAGGKRLLRGGHFSGHRAGWIFVIFDGKKGRSIRTIKQVHKALFCGLCHRVNWFPAALHGEKNRGRGEIPIPNIVPDCLIMPDSFTRLGIQCDQAIRKQIIANPVRTVKVKHGGTGGNVYDSTFDINRHAGPVVGCTGGLPRIFGPGVVSRLARTRDGMKGPAQLPGSHVKCPYVTGRRWRSLGVPATDDQQVLVNGRRTGQVNRLRSGGLAAEILPQVDAALVSKACDGPAGDRIQGINKVHDSDEDAPVLAISPICQSAVRLGSFYAGIKLPEQVAGGGIESEDFLGRRDPVKYALGHKGTGLQSALLVGIKGPGHRQPAYVMAIDLRQGRVVVVLRISAPYRPVTLLPRLVPLHPCGSGH